MHDYKITNIKSPRYPAIDFKKLRVSCIADVGSEKHMFSSHIKRSGKAGYTGLISVPIINSNKINYEITCSSSSIQ